MSGVLSQIAAAGAGLSDDAVYSLVAEACRAADYRGRKVLLIVPDNTRTAPVGLLFKAVHAQIGEASSALDVMVALGTHQPMSEEAICARLEISESERASVYGRVGLFNHAWDDPASLTRVGTISAGEIRELTHGLFGLDVPVEVNRRLFDYDELIIVGPVFPHEVVGFSGGNKYLFPGVAGPAILNFFHWLGAVITTPRIIGNASTAVRQVVDRAGSLVRLDKRCFSMVVQPDKSLAGLFFGAPESAWAEAVKVSRQCHISYKERPYDRVLSCAPAMYDEIWTAGKCMYKLEPVLADGGELIIYGPHITEISFTHGRYLGRIGYHCRDYFLNQWDRFKDYPWGVLAHSAHVYGLGSFENGIESPRARVTLATGIPEEVCRRINLGYRDPKTVRIEDYRDREGEGVLLVPRAGEMLYRLKDPPAWAQA